MAVAAQQSMDVTVSSALSTSGALCARQHAMTLNLRRSWLATGLALQLQCAMRHTERSK
jgi:hypothetical protein